MKISIIGGGISGLTTALALNKLGLPCQVYEQTPQVAEIGAGIWMQPNALKVLDWLDIGDIVRNNGEQLNRVEITDHNLHPFKATAKETVQVVDKNKITSIHRGRLQKILFDALPQGAVHLGKSYLNHQVEKENIKIQFSDSSIESDVILAADGINSKVRKQIFPDSSLRYSGQTSWRGICNIALPDELKNIGREAWGKQVRFGFSQISPDEVYWFAVANATQNKKDTAANLKSDLKTKYQDFHPIISDIIEQTDLTKIIRSDISDLNRLKSWHKDNVCLIGDAAHATTPNMGQGGGQGIEDAYYLSNILSGIDNCSEAFEKFRNSRREKVDYIVNNSWRFGKMAHSHFGQGLLKLIMKLTPEKMMMKQMHKLYELKDSFN